LTQLLCSARRVAGYVDEQDRPAAFMTGVAQHVHSMTPLMG
jgi:hypothetical protein